MPQFEFKAHIRPDFDSFRRDFIVANAPQLYYMDADQRTAALEDAYAAVWEAMSNHLSDSKSLPEVFRMEWGFNETAVEDIEIPLRLLGIGWDHEYGNEVPPWDGDDTGLLADALDL